MQEKAEKIAEKYHKGKKRRDGSDYIIHPKRVADNVSKITNDKELISAAYLHDTIEDAQENLETLKKLKEEIKNMSPLVLEYVENLSHNKNIENYEEYVKRISKNDKLLILKFCDIIDNLTDSPTEKQKEKYQKALTILLTKMSKKDFTTKEG